MLNLCVRLLHKVSVHWKNTGGEEFMQWAWNFYRSPDPILQNGPFLTCPLPSILLFSNSKERWLQIFGILVKKVSYSKSSQIKTVTSQDPKTSKTLVQKKTGHFWCQSWLCSPWYRPRSCIQHGGMNQQLRPGPQGTALRAMSYVATRKLHAILYVGNILWNTLYLLN